MKKILLPLVCFFAFACSKKQTKMITISRPVLVLKADVLANLKGTDPRPLESPGKIFVKGKYLFINEVNKGVHIIDNSNQKTPKNISFIPIPGNVDIAVKGNFLYADMYSYLIVMDITDPLQSRMVKNIPEVFNGYNYTWLGADSTQMIAEWIVKDTLVEVESSGGWGCPNCTAMEYNPSLSNSGSKNNAPGVGGSMAKFTIVNDYLYTIDNFSLSAFNIVDGASPSLKSNTNVGWSIETIYPFKNALFIGSASGMFIFNTSNPANPVKRGSFDHAKACDPVVADNTHAFVTLRTGTACQGTSNQLDVLDIKNLSQPKLIKTYLLSNPHGLAKDENILFICDGESGIKIYNAANPKDLKLIKQITNINAYDAIASNKKLLVSAKDGIYQYDYKNISNITLLSKIEKEIPNN